MDTDREHSKQQTKQSRWGFRGKTVWDFLQLLIVPLMLVAIGLVFSLQQDARQQRVEDQRAAAERELAEQRAQDEALQAYLDQMSGLLLERDLRASGEDSEVRTLARARTLTVLSKLDPSHKKELMQFLVEADLVQRLDGREPIIGLRGADLSDATLFGGFGANLREGEATPITGPVAIFVADADLRGADLYGADLSGADLSVANLRGAFLGAAFLSDANLTSAYLQDANLSGADLRDATLRYADLRDANLRGATLRGATLRDADLSGADLGGARGVTNEELDQQALSLEGATMPDGQKYEDWIKDKKAREEGG